MLSARKMEIVPLDGQGPVPQFGQVHALRMLLLIRSHQPIGRKALTRALGIGEGSIRTLLAKLEAKGLITRLRKGVTLTDAGQAFLIHIGLELAPVDAGELTIGAKDFMVQVKNAAHKIGTGTAQRDAAMLAGAKGATTLCYTNGTLNARQMTDDLSRTAPELAHQIFETFRLTEGDCIIIGTADTVEMAENGALAAAMELV